MTRGGRRRLTRQRLAGAHGRQEGTTERRPRDAGGCQPGEPTGGANVKWGTGENRASGRGTPGGRRLEGSSRGVPISARGSGQVPQIDIQRRNHICAFDTRGHWIFVGTVCPGSAFWVSGERGRAARSVGTDHSHDWLTADPASLGSPAATQQGLLPHQGSLRSGRGTLALRGLSL